MIGVRGGRPILPQTAADLSAFIVHHDEIGSELTRQVDGFEAAAARQRPHAADAQRLAERVGAVSLVLDHERERLEPAARGAALWRPEEQPEVLRLVQRRLPSRRGLAKERKTVGVPELDVDDVAMRHEHAADGLIGPKLSRNFRKQHGIPRLSGEHSFLTSVQVEYGKGGFEPFHM